MNMSVLTREAAILWLSVPLPIKQSMKSNSTVQHSTTPKRSAEVVVFSCHPTNPTIDRSCVHVCMSGRQSGSASNALFLFLFASIVAFVPLGGFSPSGGISHPIPVQQHRQQTLSLTIASQRNALYTLSILTNGPTGQSAWWPKT